MTISRRRFIETAATLGLTAAAGAALVTQPAKSMSFFGNNSTADNATADVNAIPQALQESPDLPDVVLGNPEASVTVIEYASLTCGFCAAFHTSTFPAVKERYIEPGLIRYITRMYPLDDVALSAAMVTRCGNENLYYPMLETLFERQRQWAVVERPGPELFRIARQAGFTEESFQACLTNQTLYDAILTQKNSAFEELGVQSTPTFFFNGKLVSGALSIEAFAREVDPLLEG